MKHINKIFSGGEVPICFSANSDFLPYTAIMIQSIIDHMNTANNYDIVILYRELDTTLSEMLSDMVKKHKNVSLRFFDVTEYTHDFDFFTESVYTASRYTKEIYFRLLIPTLLPEYERVIYFDGDMMARTDVASLMKYEIGDALIAAVRDYAGIAHCYIEGDDRRIHREASLGLSDVDGYVNSGMLIFNVPKFNERFDWQELLAFSAAREWRQHDQDVLNKLCEGEIYYLGGEWNYLFGNTLVKNLPDTLYREYYDSSVSPKIIHFAGMRKEAEKSSSEFAEDFWNTAKRTPFFKSIPCKV